MNFLLRLHTVSATSRFVRDLDLAGDHNSRRRRSFTTGTSVSLQALQLHIIDNSFLALVEGHIGSDRIRAWRAPAISTPTRIFATTNAAEPTRGSFVCFL